jgi:hypothetical protein
MRLLAIIGLQAHCARTTVTSERVSVATKAMPTKHDSCNTAHLLPCGEPIYSTNGPCISKVVACSAKTLPVAEMVAN